MASQGKGAELARDALVPIGKGIAGWVVKNGQPLLLNGEANPAQFPGTQKKSGNISSAMCVPLKAGRRTIGALNVNLMETDRTFSDSDLKLVDIFAHSAAIASNNAVLFKERLQRIQLRTLLEQLHSPQVVAEMIGKNGDWRKPTKMRAKHEMTVLFADIRGFSSIMTHLELEEIMDFLDAFYNAMTGIVFDNGGSIDKFIGDEVMAFFGAPLSLENASVSAARASMQMVTVFEGLRKKFSGRSHHFNELGIGIGMNTGTAFVGHVGSRKRYDYTVVGKAVNLARRLCSHAASDEILAAAETADRLNGNIPKQFVAKVPFKGLQAPVDVFRIA
jgi:adenylate cyclase